VSDSRPPPDLTGPAGRAWVIPNNPETHPAALAGYLVHSPNQHPFWSWWLVAVVSLRDEPGVPPANLTKCPEPMPGAHPYPLLTPPDATLQFHGPTDDGARAIGEHAIRAILAGEIGPDQDYRMQWRGWVDRMAKHYAGTGAVDA
jgi:hypothetical protein